MRLVPVLVVVLSLFAAGPAHARGFDGWIIGGTEAPANSYPWQVALIDGDAPLSDNGLSQFCGGTLIDPDTVVTAAHCVVDETNSTVAATEIDVFANQTDLRAPGVRRDVTQVKNGLANLSGEVPRNDVALLELASPVTSARSLDPIARQATSPAADALWSAGTLLTVTGWGVVRYEQRTPPPAPRTQVLADTLQEVEQTRTSDATCATLWPGSFSSQDMLCARGPTSGPMKDSCNGDSGGGLLARSTSRPFRWTSSAWRLVGIVSWGASPCDGAARSPGVYTRVAAQPIRDFMTSNPPAAPSPAGAPAFTGGTAVGDTLHCTPPAWGSATLTEQRFEIYRIAGTALPIRVSADTDNHVVTAGDVGASLVCLVSARSAGGQAVAESSAVAISGSSTPAAPTDPGTVTTTPSEPARPADTVIARPEPTATTSPAPTAVPADTAPPRASVVGRRICRARRCTVRILVSDPVPSSGIASVKARVRYRFRSTCRRGGRRVACMRTRTRTITAKRVSASTFSLTTPRLPKGRHTVRLTATDRAGNAQRLPSPVRLTIR